MGIPYFRLRTFVAIALLLSLLPIAFAANISACGTISTPGEHLLIQNITAQDTCLTITSSDVILDCQNFAISHNGAGNSNATTQKSGIRALNVDNLTITNCAITYANSTTGTYAHSIRLFNVQDALVQNNQLSPRMNTLTTRQTYAIKADQSTNITIENNEINASARASGVLIQNLSTNITTRNNTILVVGHETVGIHVLNATENTLINNNITTRFLDFEPGIALEFADFNNVTQNVILTNGSSSNPGINLERSNNNHITENNITTYGTFDSNYGINLESSNHNQVLSNRMNLRGDGWMHGIVLATVSFGPASTNNTIYNNDIQTEGFDWGFAVGIYMEGATYNNISTNRIFTSGAESNYGMTIWDTTSHNNTFSNNNITTSGDGPDNLGMYFWQSADNVIENNNITTNGSSASHGIFLEDGADRNQFDRTRIDTFASSSDGVRVDNSNDNIFASTLMNFITADYFNFISGIGNSIAVSVFFSGPITFFNTMLELLDDFVEIQFITPINGSVNNISNVVVFSPTSAYINSTAAPSLNTTARIIFYNITFIEPLIMADFEDDGSFIPCPQPSICQEESYQNNTYIFNTTRFSNYTLIEGAENVEPVPEFSDFALMALLVIALGGFVAMRRRA